MRGRAGHMPPTAYCSSMTSTAPIRLYSNRHVGIDAAERAERPSAYKVCDYDPQTRRLTVVEAVGCLELSVGDVFDWPQQREPWEPASFGVVTPDASGQASFPASYERAVAGQLPSSGYGPVPSHDELDWAFIDKGFIASGFGTLSRQELIDTYAKLTSGPSAENLTLAEISVLMGVA